MTINFSKSIRFLFAMAPALFLAAPLSTAQENIWPEVPVFKPYLDKPGKITKYNTFNFLTLRDESGENSRQSTGNYWEVSYVYDSVFRQKSKFRNFVVKQIIDNDGALFFEDTTQVHFAIQRPGGNIWGRLLLVNDKVYRLRIIKEQSFQNRLVFDGEVEASWNPFIEKVPLPPRIGFIPGCVIVRATHSKFHHVPYTWDHKDTLFTQKLMGPYWDFKLDAQYPDGTKDTSVSAVEVLESYFRATIKAGGTILKSRPRELIFTLKEQENTLWVRVMSSIDGTYFVRAVLQKDSEILPAEKVLQLNPPVREDSLGLEN